MEKKNLIVRKSNKLIQDFKFSLSKAEIRVVNFIIANIKSPLYSDEFNTLDFYISDFYKYLGIENPSGQDYEYVKNVIKGLKNKTSDWVKIGDYETIVSWIEKPKFYPKSGRIVLKLDDDLKPLLLQMNGYIAAQLNYYFEMDSKYSMRLYELLKSYEKLKKITFKLEDLRASIDAMKKSYDGFGKFKQGVLDIAVDEINKVTDLIVTYETDRIGQKVTHVTFYIRKKEKIMKENILSDISENVDNKIEESEIKDPYYAAIENIKINKLKGLFDGYKISDEEIYNIYLNILRKMEPVMNRLPEEQDNIIYDIVREFIARCRGKEIKKKFATYFGSIIDNEDWSFHINHVMELDDAVIKKAEHERKMAEAEAKAEAEKDAEVEAWKKAKAMERKF